MAEEKIGEVVNFLQSQALRQSRSPKANCRSMIRSRFFGHTTDVTQVIDSMEVNNQKVDKAVAGDYIGIKVADRVRPGDEVFKVIP